MRNRIAGVFAVWGLIMWLTPCLAQTTYYIDNISGNDAHNGKSPETAWKSLHKLNEMVFVPGDSILFRRGGGWKGNLLPKGSGKEGSPIVFGAYGSGPLPEIDAAGRIAPGEPFSCTIRLINQEFIEFSNLRIENYRPFEKPSLVKSSGRKVFAYSRKVGIYVEAKDVGTLHHIWFTGLEVCHINGSMATKHNGGIFMAVTRDQEVSKRRPTNFDDVMVSGCFIHDVDRTGFSNTSVWEHRSLTSRWGETYGDGKKDDWFPSKNIVVRNNRFERTGANALIVRVAESPLVEYNLFTHCAIKGSGNASFPFNCDNALFQYNEACYTVYNTEADSWDGKRDADAGGFDSDYQCKHTIIQYNYSHDNGFGGVLFCRMGTSKNTFNDGTVIRYNIFENNKNHVFRSAGPVTNTKIYNNLIYSGNQVDSVKLIYHKDWGGYSDSTLYQNNIFVSKGKGNFFDLGKSTRNHFRANLFYGSIKNQPADSLAIRSNPEFVDEAGVKGRFPFLRFALQKGSPAIDKGVPLKGQPRVDFIGNHVNGLPDIGPFELRNQP